MSCPLPVIETKKAVEATSAEMIEILVDDSVARQNVERFLGSKGYTTTTSDEDSGVSRIKGMLSKKAVNSSISPQKLVVYIDGETVGRGDEQLGKVLMRGFLNTLKELTVLPWRLIFINGGVKVVAGDSQNLPLLKDLEELGVEILSCGTCLDFYHLRENLGAGRISNMFEILTSLSEATQTIKP